MTPSTRIDITQVVCFLGLLPFVMLGLGWVLGCLHAIRYFFRWLRMQSRSTRWLTLLLPMVSPAVLVCGTFMERRPGNISTCGMIFTLLSAFIIVCTIFIGGILHTYPATEGFVNSFRRMHKWHKILLIGVFLDLLIMGLLQGAG